MGTATLAFGFLVDNWARSLGVDVKRVYAYWVFWSSGFL